MNFKLLSLLLILVLIPNCAFISFIPSPLIYTNHGKTAYDMVSFFIDSPTTNDIVLSSLTGMNCRVSNIIDEQDICIEKSATEKIQEYISSYYVDEIHAEAVW